MNEISPYIFRGAAWNGHGPEDLLARGTLEKPDGALVGVRSIVMNTGTALKCESLLDAYRHVRGASESLVIEYEPPLPEWRDRLDTLDLLRLAAFVRKNRKLIQIGRASCRERVF